MKPPLQPVVAACLLLLPPASPASASERGDAFPPAVTVDDTVLQRAGTGLLRFKRLIPVYDAALYLGTGVSPAEVLDDVPKRIEVEYRVAAKAERFCRAGDAVLARTFSPTRIAGVQSRLERINGWYPDPQPGDRCAITYVPGRGTELAFNGESLGWIEGADFAEMYFSIWLGPDPASRSLKKALLRPAPR